MSYAYLSLVPWSRCSRFHKPDPNTRRPLYSVRTPSTPTPLDLTILQLTHTSTVPNTLRFHVPRLFNRPSNPVPLNSRGLDLSTSTCTSLLFLNSRESFILRPLHRGLLSTTHFFLSVTLFTSRHRVTGFTHLRLSRVYLNRPSVSIRSHNL